MGVVGLSMVRLALVDPTTQQIIAGDDGLSETGIYAVDYKDQGSTTANITGLEGSTTKIYGNDTTQDTSIGAAAPSVAWTANNLALDVRNKIAGLVSDGKGGWTPTGVKPHVAMLIETHAIDHVHKVWYGFGNGQVSYASQNIGTDNDNQTRETDDATYTALATKAMGNQTYKLYSDIDDKFDEVAMYATVFGGYKLPAEDDSDAANTNTPTDTNTDPSGAEA